jgi:predicted MFS family arabinose efflux permease
VPERRRGAALGTFTAFFDAGVGFGAPLAGVVVALSGYEGAFVFAAAMALAAAVTVAVVLTGRGQTLLAGDLRRSVSRAG